MADDASTAVAPRPLAAWAARGVLLGIALFGLGTILVILGVRAAGLFMPGVVVIDIALLVLAASGILAIVGPDA